MRVLVVEDDESMAASLRRGLEDEGYVVEVSGDGEDGLWRATEFDFDAVVLDIMLPKLNGYRVTEQLRAKGRTVPVLMLTAKSGDLDEAEALDTGADDFLSKPFSFPVLLARLRALIRRGSSEHGSVLSAGDLHLDMAGRRCWRGDEPIELTSREFALLGYLMTHGGEVISKQQLLRHVWSDEVFDTNVVEVYIGYVRRKVDAPWARHSIETVWGSGYRLVADDG